MAVQYKLGERGKWTFYELWFEDLIIFLHISNPAEKSLVQSSTFYQHVPFIPIVGVGKERRTLIGPW